MERVNGQEGGNGLRRSKSSGITSGVAPNKTALALRIIFQSWIFNSVLYLLLVVASSNINRKERGMENC